MDVPPTVDTARLAQALGPRVGIWLIAVALLVLGSLSQWPGQVDDVYITLAFAHQLVETGQIAWSDGRIVEGYSSPLWLMVAAAASLSEKDPSLLLQVVSMAAAGGCLWLLAPARRSTLHALVLVLVSASESLNYWAANAMETMAYALTIMVGWVSLAKKTQSNVAPLALGLAALTRPEGHAHFALGLAVVAALAWPDRRQWLRWWAGIALALGTYHLGRIIYFGEALPLPVMVKALDGHGTGAGLRQLLVGDVGWLLLVAATLLARPLDRRDCWLALAPLLIQSAVLAKAGDDWMAHSRLVMPGAMASLAVAAHVGTRCAPWRRAALVLIMGAVVVVVCSPTGAPLDARWRDIRPVVGALVAPRLDLDPTLTSDLQFAIPRIPESDYFYASDVGLLGNVTGLGVRDLVGLTDRDIARSRAFGDAAALERTLARLSGDASSALCIRLVNWDDGPAPSLPPDQAAAYPLVYRLRDPWSTIAYHCRRALAVDRDLALARWSQLAERFPAHPWIGWNHALALAAVGRMEDARTVLVSVADYAPNSDFGSLGDASLAFVESSDTLVMRGDGEFALASGRRLRSRPVAPSGLAGATIRLEGALAGPARLEAEAEGGGCHEDLGVIVPGASAEIRLAPSGCATASRLVSLVVTAGEGNPPSSDGGPAWLRLVIGR